MLGPHHPPVLPACCRRPESALGQSPLEKSRCSSLRPDGGELSLSFVPSCASRAQWGIGGSGC